MSHTQGKIEVRTYDGSIGTIDSIEGEFTLAQAQAIPITGRGIVAAQEERKENARRLVACWNACDGIDTEDLERGNKYCEQPMLQRGLQNMKALDLIKERAELRAAVEEAYAFLQVVDKINNLGEYLKNMIGIRDSLHAVLAKYPKDKSWT